MSLEAFAILEGHFNFNNTNFLVSIKRDNTKGLSYFNCVIKKILGATCSQRVVGGFNGFLVAGTVGSFTALVVRFFVLILFF